MYMEVYYLDSEGDVHRAWNSGCSTELEESKCVEGTIVSLHCGYGVMRDHLVTAHPTKGHLIVVDFW